MRGGWKCEIITYVIMKTIFAVLLIGSIFDIGRVNCKVSDQLLPCVGKDPDCLKAVADSVLTVLASGDPLLSLTALDPINLPDVLNLNVNALDIVLANITVSGLGSCLSLYVGLEDLTLDVSLQCCLTIVADIVIDTDSLGLPIDIEGVITIVLNSVTIELSLDAITRTTNGLDHYDISNFTQKTGIPLCVQVSIDGVDDSLTGLVGEILSILNGSWQSYFEDCIPTLIDSLVDEVLDVLSGVLSGLSVDQVLHILSLILS